MAQLIITSTDTGGDKNQTVLTDINPTASNNDLKDFAEQLNALTTNTYVGTIRVDREDITNGGEGGGGANLEEVGYSFYPDDNNTAAWNATPAEFAPKMCNGKDNPMFSIVLMSKLGDGYYSGARAVTFSGYKPKGSTLVFQDMQGIVQIKMPDKPSYSMDNGQYYQLQVHIAPTEQYAGGTIYLYFYAMAEDMEEI